MTIGSLFQLLVSWRRSDERNGERDHREAHEEHPRDDLPVPSRLQRAHRSEQ